ncbi:MAG: MFS transporter [Lachnospiraceae bacterium]|jgi:MFS family permease|nr:MFS transporter [Lachnospiraceae bacterium]
MKKNNKSNFSKFILLWAGELISGVGGGLTSFGLGVYVFQKTGSAASMALVTLLAFLPTLLFSVPAGVLADRYDRRLLMMIGDGCSALGIFYILVCMRSGEAALYQICIGVFVSAVFSALLEPAYRATVTDLLTKEEYSRAGGMVSIAGSARYLISPVLAGALLAVSDMRLLLLIDICTFFPTVIGAAVVRKEIAVKEKAGEESFIESFRQGWRAVTGRRGILILITVSALITFFMGTFQILAQPVILNFADSTVLGIGETVCACGMLVSGLFLGVKGIKSGHARILSVSLFIAGIGMAGFGVRENIFCACGFGFLFFAMLPFANNCLDYLIRRNIPDALQGRAWGLIGFLSQIGYVAAYGLAGAAADKAAEKFRVSVGRGAAGIVMAAGALLGLTAFFLYFVKSVRALEEAG